MTAPAAGGEHNSAPACETISALGLSALTVGALILGINFLPVPDKSTVAIGLLVVALAAAVGFLIRQRRAKNPRYDLDVAA